MWIIHCPACPNRSPLESYEPSCADECICPRCGESFTIDWDAIHAENDDEDDE